MQFEYAAELMEKYIEIIDKRTNNVVASGKVTGSKNDIPNGGISFDCKWFFREGINLLYKEVDFVETKLVSEKELNDLNIKWDYLKVDNERIKTLDVRRDFGYDEIDKEIKDYVYKLNEIKNTIKTTTSCCGHGIRPWYIEFEFSEFWDLSKFVNIVDTFEGKLILVTNDAGKTIKKKNIHLMLKPTIEDYDFKLLDSFCKKISMFI